MVFSYKLNSVKQAQNAIQGLETLQPGQQSRRGRHQRVAGRKP